MSITLQCPRLTCRTILQVPDNARGKRVRCAECGAPFVVPATGQGGPPNRKDPVKSGAKKDTR